MVLRLALFLCLSLLLEACYLSHYPVTPKVASASTYRIFNTEVSGTAWAAGPGFVVTAGHVCEKGGPFTLSDGHFNYPAEPVVWVDGPIPALLGPYGLEDLCVLSTRAKVVPMIIAPHMPRPGDTVWYTGYPRREFGTFFGPYYGDLDGPESTMNDYASGAPCAPGASGSAMYTEAGVWGVLVRIRTDGGFIHTGPEGCVAIPLHKLLAILNVAGVDYNLPPEMPPEM